MRMILRTAMCWCLCVATVQAAKFPYRAAIEGHDVYARSGPGKSYYPTSRLTTGDEVTVHRHDPGGWYMIAPPPGSFSWIRAEYVRKTGPKAGELTANNVVVRVGSEFGDTRDVEQRRLSRGDVVEILGEQTFVDDGDSIRMYKIQPPQGEWRWVPGQDAVPANGNRSRRAPDPFAPPAADDDVPRSLVDRQPTPDSRSARTDTAREEKDPFVARSLNRSVPKEGVARRSPEEERLQVDRDRLAAIDQEFRKIVSRDMREWELDPLEAEYRDLRQAAAHPALAHQVDLRLDAVARYRDKLAEYDDFIRLTRETDRRDQQLLSLQTEHQPEEIDSNSIDSEPPASGRSDSAPGTTQRDSASPTPHEVRSPPRFDGAGIVRRTTGTPAYVLMAPDDRILAYLEAEAGVNLDQYVGRAVGIHGERKYRSDLQADHLRVRDLTPVRLKR